MKKWHLKQTKIIWYAHFIFFLGQQYLMQFQVHISPLAWRTALCMIIQKCFHFLSRHSIFRSFPCLLTILRQNQLSLLSSGIQEHRFLSFVWTSSTYFYSGSILFLPCSHLWVSTLTCITGHVSHTHRNLISISFSLLISSVFSYFL